MVGTDNLKYDIEALSTERDAFRKQVEELNDKCGDLFVGVRDAEHVHRIVKDELSRKQLPSSPKK